MLVSMSGRGNCYDNAMVETVFKTFEVRTGVAHDLYFAAAG